MKGDMSSAPHRKPLLAVAAWGVLGFAAILVRAIWSLTPLALEPILDGSLSTFHGGLYLLWVGFMAYSEGYRGFHKKVAPRVAVRAMYAATHRHPLRMALAPFFCMGLFHATRKRLIVSWCILVGVISLVVLVRHLDQPWRGIVDGGVVVGLLWGLLAILWYFVRSLMGYPPAVPAEVPEPAPRAS
jgi:hypothetical protein